MTILDEIVAYKRQTIGQQKLQNSIKQFESSPYFERKALSLKDKLLQDNQLGIIAEFKRRSPSKGVINDKAQVVVVTTGYQEAGASALSVLTDQHYFGGHSDDLTTARKINAIPILRKDFIVSDYQIVEAKAIGADVILLIAACLSATEIRQFTQTAHSLSLEVLLELHDDSELNKIDPSVDMIGVNNRNLKDFTVDFRRSIDMLPKLPTEAPKIAESGISQPSSIVELKQAGFHGFLIGETFMKSPQPEKACRTFIQEVQALGQIS